MLIHGRLLVTENGFMLDEVKSLLQKSLRRKEQDLVRKATKELTCGKKDQLQWKGIVTYLFEDHCLNHVNVLQKVYRLYLANNKRGSVELLSRSYTCRYSACAQVVAISEEYRTYEEFWDCSESVDPVLAGLVVKKKGAINCDRLLTCIVKFWKLGDTKKLTSLFGLINMVAKVECRTLTNAGIDKLLSRSIKKPTIYHLVLSVLHKYAAEDDYTNSMIDICHKFASIADVPQGLILFSVLAQKIYKSAILEKPVPELITGSTNWSEVGLLTHMPHWAVDKHTYRGKFGRSSAELFKKKFKQFSFSEAQLEEFHGERTKVGIPHFFDVGCICNKDILLENPIWEKTKEMYLTQKPSLQKAAKMTQLYYNEIKKETSVVFYPTDVQFAESSDSDEEEIKRVKPTLKRKQSKPCISSSPPKKQRKLTDFGTDASRPEASTSKPTVVGPNVKGANKTRTIPSGPLLQLPTGSGKVYTILDTETNKVWKGPYKSQDRINLCKFYHKAMKEIFGDVHTLGFEEKSAYMIFPLIMSRDAQVSVTKRAFYDCISRKEISYEEGKFVERESLGIIQLHKLHAKKIKGLPVSIWAHFAFRFVLNVGDTGLYNAIATNDLSEMYGIDMEERRKQVKGNDVINMMFGKLPRKEIVAEITQALYEKIEDFYQLIDKKFDFGRLRKLFLEYSIPDETSVCERRLVSLKAALDKQCHQELGV